MSTDGGRHSGGRLIGGRYRLAERIGSGGMGTVWRAVDELVGRDVAVKQPRLPGDPHDAAQRRMYARLQREARAAARVEHPAAVAIHDVVVEDELPWIVMELIRGDSLHELLKRGALPPAESARIGLAVVGALAAAHAKGIVHRDVKPANVLIGSHGRVVLTDFGIAHIQGEESLTVSGEFVGSLEFIAPERMSGSTAGPESDLWSLGVLLYSAVEGWSPFRRTTVESTLAAVLAAEVPPLVRAGELGPLIERLLSRDPALRPGAPEVALALEAVADGRALPEPYDSEVVQDPSGLRELADDVGTVRLKPESRPAPRPAPDAGEAAASAASAEPKRRRATGRLVAAAVLGAVLVGGGVWLGTSLGDGGDPKVEADTGKKETGETDGGKTGDGKTDGGKADGGNGKDKESPAAGSGDWTTHKEPKVDAEISVPSTYTEITRDPANPIVEYSEPDGLVSLRVTKPATAAPTPALAWANAEAKEIEGVGYEQVNTSTTRTSFHGQDAALLDATYTEEAEDDLAEPMVTRELRLLIVTDAGEHYDLMVRMPKGVKTHEKRGTDLFKAARERLGVGSPLVGGSRN
ncbi:serine/threonine-protein kinase [Streptomyces longisporoflavus]|uniref:serine/threonine-protein kinase n=1 Tax=Streptomyces longisporoflavus TaxID=28044 RepID=UPI00167CAAF4|nr:serine/threonine-protein kinase [Streptomyces longisporoflavus]